MSTLNTARVLIMLAVAHMMLQHAEYRKQVRKFQLSLPQRWPFPLSPRPARLVSYVFNDALITSDPTAAVGTCTCNVFEDGEA